MRVGSDVVEDNIALLEQGMELIARLDSGLYAGAGEPAGRGVGAQVRHALDHHISFLAGAETRVIDYDRRERDTRLETSVEAALERFVELIERLAALDRAGLDEPAVLVVGADEDGRGEESPTSLRRELHFLLSHTVHHYALIALLLARRGIEVDPEFGVAPSTLRHWARRERCERPAG